MDVFRGAVIATPISLAMWGAIILTARALLG
jgi:hypothetical protein